MSGTEAVHRLRELVRLRQDVERFQRAQSALGACPEVQSSASQQLANLARQAKVAADRVETDLVRLLAGSKAVMGSEPYIDLETSDGALTTSRI